MNTLKANILYALRQFRQAPIFTATAILTMALGIGGTTAIFTLIHAIMLRSLPVADLEPGHRVVGVEEVLAEHPLEHVETAVDLLAVARAVGPRELLCVDVLSHGVTLGSAEVPGLGP